MKIKRVLANNKRKSFLIETGSQRLEFPYSQLSVKPSKTDPIVHVEPDDEIGAAGFCYRLKSGEGDMVLLDQVKDYAKDPDYLCEAMLYELTVRAQREIRSKTLSKRELARRLRTSPKQLDRLLDQTFYGKTINQMIRLLYVLKVNVELKLKNAA